MQRPPRLARRGHGDDAIAAQVHGLASPLVRGAVFFDVDGTLVPGTSSSEHVARHLGGLPAAAAAQAAYDEGRIDCARWCELDARTWAGSTPERARAVLEQLPLIAGIDEVVAWCREHDLLPTLGTLAWEPVGRHLCERFGFARATGPRLEEVDGRYTGGVAAHFDEHDKRDSALALAAELGVAIEDCAAVGDSRSDVPLFAVVGMPVALNATPALRALARACVDSDDLRDVLPVLDAWLTG